MMDCAHLEVDDPRWREALGRLPHDFYHLPEYVRLDGEWNQARPRAFLARTGAEEYSFRICCAGVTASSRTHGRRHGVRRGLAVRVSRLLLSDAARMSPGFARQALHRLSESLREMGVCSAFFRMHPLLSHGLSELFPEGVFTPAGETVAMDLTLDEGKSWKGIREGHQWTIKKCQKRGFVARSVSLRDSLEGVMEIYWDTMDRVQAKESYYFGREYFARLGEMPEQVHCWVVEAEGRPAAACIFFECGGIVQAHLGGTRSEFLSQSPFHLLLYSAAGWARSRGNRYLHLGGGVGGSNDRLLQFKLGFSQLRFPFSTLRLITDEGKYRELTARRARAAEVPVEEFSRGDFFPAYRAPAESSLRGVTGSGS